MWSHWTQNIMSDDQRAFRPLKNRIRDICWFWFTFMLCRCLRHVWLIMVTCVTCFEGSRKFEHRKSAVVRGQHYERHNRQRILFLARHLPPCFALLRHVDCLHMMVLCVVLCICVCSTRSVASGGGGGVGAGVCVSDNLFFCAFITTVFCVEKCTAESVYSWKSLHHHC